MTLAGTGTNQASKDALDTLRDTVVPATVGSVGGAEANVTGNTAIDRDSAANLARTTPLIFGFVLTLAFLLMLVTFRSIVIPIKAIVLNLLSVAAAYGVLVLGVPGRPRLVAAGLLAHRRRGTLAADLPVRDPVRPLDGLPRVHPEPGQGAGRRRRDDR